MALINCPECSKEISDTVARCPHCGYKIKRKKGKKVLKILGITVGSVIALLIAALVVLMIIGHNKNYKTDIKSIPLDTLGEMPIIVTSLPEERMGDIKPSTEPECDYFVEYTLDEPAFIGGVHIYSVDIGFKEGTGMITCIRWGSGLGNQKEMGDRLAKGAEKLYGKPERVDYDPGDIFGDSFLYEWDDAKGFDIHIRNTNIGESWSCTIYWYRH